eukprot:scaffold1843_cov161-Pinguiococcus_pyrenoidosus.AAC.1
MRSMCAGSPQERMWYSVQFRGQSLATCRSVCTAPALREIAFSALASRSLPSIPSLAVEVRTWFARKFDGEVDDGPPWARGWMNGASPSASAQRGCGRAGRVEERLAGLPGSCPRTSSALPLCL